MGKSFIFGLGSGRCGSLSLATLLDAQYVTSISFERYYKLPWVANYDALTHTFRLIRRHIGSFIGDVGFYYLSYVEKIIDVTKGNVKFVCIKRNKQDTVNSQLRASSSLGAMHVVDEHSKYFNPDINLNSIENITFRPAFPKYDLPLEDAWAQYHDDYYKKADSFEERYPGIFKVFDMDTALNTNEGQLEMLKWTKLQSQFVLPNIKIFKEFTGDPNQFK